MLPGWSLRARNGASKSRLRPLPTAALLLALAPVLAGCDATEDAPADTGPQVTVSGTIAYPEFTAGVFYVIAQDTQETIHGMTQLAGGTSVPYALEIAADTGPVRVLAAVDHDSDAEFTHFVEPCHLQPVEVGVADLPGVDFTLQTGGCLEDMTGGSPFVRFAQAKPWPAHFAHDVTATTTYTVSTSDAAYPVDLAVHEDTNGNSRYDAGTDLLLCTSAVTATGAESCDATPATTRLILIVTVEAGSPERDVPVTLSVQ